MLYIYYRVVETWRPMKDLDKEYSPTMEGIRVVSEEPLVFPRRFHSFESEMIIFF